MSISKNRISKKKHSELTKNYTNLLPIQQKKPFEIFADTSNHATGVVFIQRDDNRV